MFPEGLVTPCGAEPARRLVARTERGLAVLFRKVELGGLNSQCGNMDCAYIAFFVQIHFFIARKHGFNHFKEIVKRPCVCAGLDSIAFVPKFQAEGGKNIIVKYPNREIAQQSAVNNVCLLYTSDAADD